MKGGQPQIPKALTKELIDRICTRLIDGESLRKICADDDMPHKSTFLLWTSKSGQGEIYTILADQYARARQLQAESLGDDLIDLSDEANQQTANAIRVRVDTRKWVMAKQMPKKYGDKMEVDHSGGVNMVVESVKKPKDSGISDS